MNKISIFISFFLLLICYPVTNIFAQSIPVEQAFSETFDNPVGMVYSHEGSNLLYIVRKTGYVDIVDLDDRDAPSDTFIDISDRISNPFGEMGLLGMAFSPNYQEDDTFYLYHTFRDDGEYYSTLARYKAPGGVADPDSEERLFVLHQPQDNHNGGQLKFGPDGYLYLAIGDGGRDSDFLAQDTGTLNGTIIRIDVSTETGYEIPPDNPFIDDDDILDEIYAWGLRNPWRMSFDPVTGNLWAADVGQKDWESIYIIEKGKNYGWPVIEGSACYPMGTECDKTGLEMPLYEYPWGDEFGKSITGGYVYRGSNNPSLYGKYIYGDFITRQIWALEIDHQTREIISNTEIATAEQMLPSFGLDSFGEIYMIGWGESPRIFSFEQEETQHRSEPPPAIALEFPDNDATDIILQPEIGWKSSDLADTYHLQIADNREFNQPVAELDNLQRTTFIPDLPLTFETEYFWRVRGENEAGTGRWSDIHNFKTITEPAVTNLNISKENNELHLKWGSNSDVAREESVASVEYVEEYIIYRGESVSTMSVLEEIPSGSTSYTDDDITEGSVFYTVAARDIFGNESELTQIVSYYNSEDPLYDGWRLMSLPYHTEGLTLPNSVIFSFNGMYRQESEMLPKKGYWVRSSEVGNFAAEGTGIQNGEISLHSGWNLVGSLIDTVAADSISDPDGILTSTPVYSFTKGVYRAAEYLVPGQAYWIFAEEEGEISMEIKKPKTVSKSIEQDSEPKVIPQPDQIIFTLDTLEVTLNGYTHTLTDAEKFRYLVPPLSPDPVLDVRTNDGFMVTDSDRTLLDVKAASYPVGIMLKKGSEMSDKLYRIVAEHNGETVHIDLLPDSRQFLEKEYSYVAIERVENEALVTETRLDASYPNPFNPTTNIRYRLAEQGQILIAVYDVTGRRVATLVNGEQNAGIYTVPFDGSAMASGVYFVRLQVDEFAEVQKLTLIK